MSTKNTQAESEDFGRYIALAHLSMIVQAAKGEVVLDPVDLENRQAMVVAYLQTGQCLASDQDRTLIDRIKGLLSDQEATPSNSDPGHEQQEQHVEAETADSALPQCRHPHQQASGNVLLEAAGASS